MNAATLPISEISGPVTIPHGRNAGTLCTLIRVGHCNLSCPGCTVPHTWDRRRYDVPTQSPQTDVHDVLDAVMDRKTRVTLLTGGEPLMWQRSEAFVIMLAGLEVWGPIHVETNGTITPSPEVQERVTHFTVSPKIGPLVNPLDTPGDRVRRNTISAFVDLAKRGYASFLFPCAKAEDVAAVEEFCESMDVDRSMVWISPFGSTEAAVEASVKATAGPAVTAGLHLAWRPWIEAAR